MRWLILCLLVTSAVALKLHNKHPCDEKECRAGRECIEDEGEAQCVCVISCPDHFKPVCGSDEISYDNHCRLHQKACISGNHISIKHKGHCKSSLEKLWKKKDAKKSLLSRDDLEDELQNDLIDRLKQNERKIPEHKKSLAVCYGPQRNAIRFLLVEYFEDELDNQEWHLEGMTYREGLWGWFYACDTNKDKSLTSEELLTCAKKVNFFARPGQDNELTKELCIDALLDDGDKNRDLMLDFEEFTRIMDPKYQPKDKACSLKGKHYVDGEEVHVDCNQCVCAVGNWICASTECKEISHKKKVRFANSIGHKSEIDNAIDIPIDSPNDVIDHAEVADLWMENNKKDKEKGKKAKEEKVKEEFDVDDNLFADFDDENEEKTEKKDKDEEKELHMDDYYDDLYEKTKMKNHKKNQHQLEKALKEVKILRKKTDNLKKLLKHQREISKKDQLKDEDEDSEEIIVEKQILHPKKNLLKKKSPNSNKYYDEIFKNTKWNDLVDWGDLKKLNKDKDFDLHNYL